VSRYTEQRIFRIGGDPGLIEIGVQIFLKAVMAGHRVRLAAFLA
jgi:hypothetical protein